MSIATELAQREMNVWEAARRPAPPQEYEPVYQKWEEALPQFLNGRNEASLGHLAEIESLLAAGNILGAYRAHCDMIRESFEQLPPLQQKKLWEDCQPKSHSN